MKNKKFDDCMIIKLPKELKEKIDQKINGQYMNRSEYIRKLILRDLEEE